MTTVQLTGPGVVINAAAPALSDVRAAAAAATSAASDARTAAMDAQAVVAAGQAASTLGPNLMSDTRHFRTLGGVSQRALEDVFAAHTGSAFSAVRRGTGAVVGQVRVVPLSSLGAVGAPWDAGLAPATPGPAGRVPWTDDDFACLRFIVELGSGGAGLDVLRQSDPTMRYTGETAGGFAVQTACFVNVLSRTGSIVFNPSTGLAGELTADPAASGWQYLHASRTGFNGGANRASFSGSGRIDVIMALPYVGTGNHGGSFVHATSLGRYTHGDDRLPSGVLF